MRQSVVVEYLCVNNIILHGGIMSNSYKTVYNGGTGEIIEKKSRFIANVFLVKSEAEAEAYIEQTRKKYWDARHNCYAYVIGSRGEKQKCSDDGEPSGTAGRPMLDVILGEKLCNVLVIVTRYFGGTLLGTGGLVRAYSSSVKEGLANSSIIEKRQATKICVTTDYTGIGKLQYIAAQMDISILDTIYEDIVRMILLVPSEQYLTLVNKVNEATQASAIIEENGELWYAKLEDGSINVFED